MDTYWSVFSIGIFKVGYSLRNDKISRLILSCKNPESHNSFNFFGKYQKRLLTELEDKISTYFNGGKVCFDEFPVELNTYCSFAKKVLDSCRTISYSKTITYGRLAKMSGSEYAARAVGNALSKNPVCLIIPCHRVICSDGKIGGFMYGTELKRKLLKIEGILV